MSALILPVAPIACGELVGAIVVTVPDDDPRLLVGRGMVGVGVATIIVGVGRGVLVGNGRVGVGVIVGEGAFVGVGLGVCVGVWGLFIFFRFLEKSL
jgi:hypothetical protein